MMGVSLHTSCRLCIVACWSAANGSWAAEPESNDALAAAVTQAVAEDVDALGRHPDVRVAIRPSTDRVWARHRDGLAAAVARRLTMTTSAVAAVVPDGEEPWPDADEALVRQQAGAAVLVVSFEGRDRLDHTTHAQVTLWTGDGRAVKRADVEAGADVEVLWEQAVAAEEAAARNVTPRDVRETEYRRRALKVEHTEFYVPASRYFPARVVHHVSVRRGDGHILNELDVWLLSLDSDPARRLPPTQWLYNIGLGIPWVIGISAGSVAFLAAASLAGPAGALFIMRDTGSVFWGAVAGAGGVVGAGVAGCAAGFLTGFLAAVFLIIAGSLFTPEVSDKGKERLVREYNRRLAAQLDLDPMRLGDDDPATRHVDACACGTSPGGYHRERATVFPL